MEVKMKLSFFVGAIGGFAALTLSSGVFAATLWLKCQHCDSSNAQQFAEQSRRTGAVMVYSLNNRFHAKFENQWDGTGAGCHPNGNDGPVKPGTNYGPQDQQSVFSPPGQQSGNCSNVLIATPATPDAEQNELMRILQLLSDNSGGSMKVRIDMTGVAIGAPDGTAHEYPNDVEFARITRNEVWRLLNSPTSAANFHVDNLDALTFSKLFNIIRTAGFKRLGHQFRAYGQIAVGGVFAQVTVVITFVDGSTVTLGYNGDGALTSETALSAEQREIMTSKNIEGFTHQPLPMENDRSVEAFLENAQRLQVRVRATSGSRLVRCTTEPDIHTNKVITTCTSE